MEDNEVKKTETKVVKLLTTDQAINQLKVKYHFRNFVAKKYKGKSFTLKEWKDNLKKDGLTL